MTVTTMCVVQMDTDQRAEDLLEHAKSLLSTQIGSGMASDASSNETSGSDFKFGPSQ